MEKEKLSEVKVIVLCIVVAFFLMLSMKANAQTSHIVDTIEYKYFDLSYRPISNSFFYQPTLGWRMRMIADDGIREREVFVDTIERPINTYKY